MIRLYDLLSEQITDNKVIQAYTKIIVAGRKLKTARVHFNVQQAEDAVNLIYTAIKTLQTKKQVLDLIQLFTNGKSGYKSFEDFISYLYYKFTYKTVEKLISLLYSRGLVYIAGSLVSKSGTKRFDGGFLYKGSKSVHADPARECTIWPEVITQYNKLLPQAIGFWKNWLSDPATQNKIIKNWSLYNKSTSLSRLNDIANLTKTYQKYYNVLDNLKIEFYHCNTNYTKTGIQLDDEDRLRTYAFVNKHRMGLIHVNASIVDNNALDTLIHEIQHLLYYIKPINPAKQIRNVFVGPNNPPESISSIKQTNLPNSSTIDPKLNVVSNKYNINANVLATWLTIKPLNPGYKCRETEKMSNIIAIRHHFKMKPSDKLTVNMLRPYINREKHHTDVSWFLSCWAENGFPDLQQLINRTNQLAINTKSSTSTQRTTIA